MPADAVPADAASADAASADAAYTSPPDSGPPGGSNLFAYPKNGQSADQQTADRNQCEQWAGAQTGSSPGASANGAPEYRRALAACLEGRGYSVD